MLTAVSLPLLCFAWMQKQAFAEKVSMPETPRCVYGILPETVVVHAVSGGAECDVHGKAVEYRFRYSVLPVDRAGNPGTGTAPVTPWNGSTQTLRIPRQAAESVFLHVSVCAQARCILNPLVLSEWSEPAVVRFIPTGQQVYIPRPEQTVIEIRRNAAATVARVTIQFTDSGFKVLDWGNADRAGRTFLGDAAVVRFGEVTLPVITPVSYDYPLGNLAPGEYLFVFKAWGVPVKAARFKVGLPLGADINSDGRVDIQDVMLCARIAAGEPVAVQGETCSPPYPPRLTGAADVNDDGSVDASDIILLLRLQ